jgi:hypothetical protein
MHAMSTYNGMKLGAKRAVTAAILALGLAGFAGPEQPASGAPTPGKGAAQLWAENCGRCHNFRPPGEFSDAQWEVIVHHMRVRANLTASEHRSILAFLKASN